MVGGVYIRMAGLDAIVGNCVRGHMIRVQLVRLGLFFREPAYVRFKEWLIGRIRIPSSLVI